MLIVVTTYDTKADITGRRANKNCPKCNKTTEFREVEFVTTGKAYGAIEVNSDSRYGWRCGECSTLFMEKDGNPPIAVQVAAAIFAVFLIAGIAVAPQILSAKTPEEREQAIQNCIVGPMNNCLKAVNLKPQQE
jgi:hypothetical protein